MMYLYMWASLPIHGIYFWTTNTDTEFVDNKTHFDLKVLAFRPIIHKRISEFADKKSVHNEVYVAKFNCLCKAMFFNLGSVRIPELALFGGSAKSVIPKVCSADHWWSARLAEVVRQSLYISILCFVDHQIFLSGPRAGKVWEPLC